MISKQSNCGSEVRVWIITRLMVVPSYIAYIRETCDNVSKFFTSYYETIPGKRDFGWRARRELSTGTCQKIRRGNSNEGIARMQKSFIALSLNIIAWPRNRGGTSGNWMASDFSVAEKAGFQKNFPTGSLPMTLLTPFHRSSFDKAVGPVAAQRILDSGRTAPFF